MRGTPRRPDGSVGMALVLPALTDVRIPAGPLGSFKFSAERQRAPTTKNDCERYAHQTGEYVTNEPLSRWEKRSDTNIPEPKKDLAVPKKSQKTESTYWDWDLRRDERRYEQGTE